MNSPTQLSLEDLKRLNELTNQMYEDCGGWPELDDELEPLMQRLSDVSDEIAFITHSRIEALEDNECDHESGEQILPAH